MLKVKSSLVLPEKMDVDEQGKKDKLAAFSKKLNMLGRKVSQCCLQGTYVSL